MTTTNPEQIGTWLLALGGIVGILLSIASLVLAIKKLLEEKPKDLQPLTRADAAQFATRIELQNLKEEIQGVQTLIDKQQNYIQTRFHDLANQLAPLPTQIGILIKQVDKLDSRSERMLTTLETRNPKEAPHED